MFIPGKNRIPQKQTNKKPIIFRLVPIFFHTKWDKSIKPTGYAEQEHQTRPEALFRGCRLTFSPLLFRRNQLGFEIVQTTMRQARPLPTVWEGEIRAIDWDAESHGNTVF